MNNSRAGGMSSLHALYGLYIIHAVRAWLLLDNDHGMTGKRQCRLLLVRWIWGCRVNLQPLSSSDPPSLLLSCIAAPVSPTQVHRHRDAHTAGSTLAARSWHWTQNNSAGRVAHLLQGDAAETDALGRGWIQKAATYLSPDSHSQR